MAEPFDPYYVWLGIPPREQPANRYRLLSVPLFESNPDVIDNAADQRTAHLRTFQSSKNAQLAERLLNEVAAARVCLLDPKKRAAYDQKLRATSAAQTPAPSSELPAQVTPIGAKPGATRSTAKVLPIRLLVGAGMLLIAAIGIGVYSFTSTTADGALTFDWPSDARTGVTLTVDAVAVLVPSSGGWEYRCPPGEHHVVAVRPLFKPMDFKVSVASGEQQTVAADWKPQSVLALDWHLDDRRGAELSIDGRVRVLPDRERFEFPIEPGTHVVRITRPNAPAFQTTVVIAADKRQTVVVPPIPTMATLLIQLPLEQRRDAKLSIDDRTPPTTEKPSPDGLELSLKPGRHSVRITRPGFQPFEQIVEVAAGDTSPLVPTWIAEPKTASPTPPTQTIAMVQAVDSPPASPAVPDSGPDANASSPPPKKLSIPNADDQKRIAKQLDEIYKLSHSPAKDAKAKELYDVADKAKDTPAERYMLLMKSAELAADAGDAALAFQAIDMVDAEYEMDDPWEVKKKLLEHCVKAAATAEQASALIATAEQMMDQAFAADDYETALAISMTTGQILGRKFVSYESRKDEEEKLTRRRRAISELQPLWAAAQKAQQALRKTPADAEANTILGRWLCFCKGDWSNGLPLLSKGSDDRLKTLAQTELKVPLQAEKQVELADAWWDLGEKGTASARDALRLHAADLYKTALPGIKSPLRQAVVEKRIADSTNSERQSGVQAKKVPQLSGTYRITNRQSNRYLAIAGGSTNEGGNVIVWSDAGGDDKVWTFIPLHGGEYEIQNKASGLFLAVRQASQTAGTDLIQWSKTGQPGQHWIPEPVGKGFVKLVNKNSGLCLSRTFDRRRSGPAAIQRVGYATVEARSKYKMSIVRSWFLLSSERTAARRCPGRASAA